jgi:hypothetical protein
MRRFSQPADYLRLRDGLQSPEDTVDPSMNRSFMSRGGDAKNGSLEKLFVYK